MSGRKTTTVDFDAERKRRERLVRQLGQMRRDLQGNSCEMDDVLTKAAKQAGQLFAAEMTAARVWRDKLYADSDYLKSWSLADAEDSLRGALDRLRVVQQEGRKTRDDLIRAYSERVERARDQLTRRIRDLESLLGSHHSLIRRWLGESDLRAVGDGLQNVANTVGTGRLDLLGPRLTDLETKARSIVEESVRREAAQVQEARLRHVALIRRDVEQRILSIEAELAQSSSGLQATFPREVAAVAEWLARARDLSAQSDRLPQQAAPETLRQFSAQLASCLEDGDARRELLLDAFRRQAASLRQEARDRIATLESTLAGGKDLLTAWSGPGEVSRLQVNLGAVKGLLQADALQQALEAYPSVDKALRASLASCEEKEGQHHNRLYVIDSVRETCRQSGFVVEGEARFEHPADRGSRMWFKVDTLTQGEIVFVFTLDGIEADVGVHDEYCISELDKLSAVLADRFGLKTSFRRPENEPLPELRRKGELGQEDGGQLRAEMPE